MSLSLSSLSLFSLSILSLYTLVVTNFLLIFACDFMSIENILGTEQGTFGLFKYQDPLSSDGECIDISENSEYLDGWFKTAQTCSIIALCSGAILAFYATCQQCICPLPCSQLVLDLSSTLTQVCLALVYLVWGSDVCKQQFNCYYGDSGGLLIATQVFWLAAGCFTRCMRDGRHERRDEIAANKKAKAEEKARKEAEAEAELEEQRNQQSSTNLSRNDSD